MSGRVPLFLSWYGGKARVGRKIAELIPDDTAVYVEPFGGGAAVLFNKEPSPIEVYNDLDGDLVNLFRVLRDYPAELREKLELTPFSAEEFYNCKSRLVAGDIIDPIERARAYYTVVINSFGNAKTGFNRDINAPRSSKRWLNKIDKGLPAAIARFRSVQIDNLDYALCIRKYDSPGTLTYCDPPYVEDTLSVGGNRAYVNSLPLEEHKKLVALLLAAKGKVILSGYAHPVYAPLLAGGFRQIKLKEQETPIARRRNAEAETGKRGIEILWLNF